MQFHYDGYATGDPMQMRALKVARNLPPREPARGHGRNDRWRGPVGTITAAQLSRFPNITTRLVERSDRRLELANADGVHSRTD